MYLQSPEPMDRPYPDDDTAADIERAVAELRFGRPVIIDEAEHSIALLALDAATPAQLAQFCVEANGSQSLYLSRHRGEALGLGIHPRGIVVPLNGSDFATISRLSYGLGASLPMTWQPAADGLGSLCELARVAQLLPAFVFSEITPADRAFAGYARLRVTNIIERSKAARSNFTCIARTTVPLEGLGDCECLVFRGGLAQRDQVAIIIGKPVFSQAVPIRIHSSCITGDLLGSLKCDCGEQLRHAMAKLADLGGGVLFYLDQEGRGTGLASKLRAYSSQRLGLDTIDADAQLGFGPDERSYETVLGLVRELGISRVTLLTNNPHKAAFLIDHGIHVDACLPITGPVRAENCGYLETKARRSGHQFPCGYLDIDVQTAGLADGQPTNDVRSTPNPNEETP